MSRRQRDSVAADALLDGMVDDGSALAAVLAAARTAGQPEEMTGLDAALTAFTATGPLAPVPRATAAPAITRTIAGRSVAVKAVVFAGGTMLVGGVAVAAVVNTVTAPAPIAPPRHHASTSSNVLGTGGAGGAGGAVGQPSSASAGYGSAAKPAATDTSAAPSAGASGASSQSTPSTGGHPSHPSHPGHSKHQTHHATT